MEHVTSPGERMAEGVIFESAPGPGFWSGVDLARLLGLPKNPHHRSLYDEEVASGSVIMEGCTLRGSIYSDEETIRVSFWLETGLPEHLWLKIENQMRTHLEGTGFKEPLHVIMVWV